MCKVGLPQNPTATWCWTRLSRYRKETVYTCFTSGAVFSAGNNQHRVERETGNSVRFVKTWTDEQPQRWFRITISLADGADIVLRLQKISHF